MQAQGIEWRCGGPFDLPGSYCAGFVFQGFLRYTVSRHLAAFRCLSASDRAARYSQR